MKRTFQYLPDSPVFLLLPVRPFFQLLLYVARLKKSCEYSLAGMSFSFIFDLSWACSVKKNAHSQCCLEKLTPKRPSHFSMKHPPVIIFPERMRSCWQNPDYTEGDLSPKNACRPRLLSVSTNPAISIGISFIPVFTQFSITPAIPLALKI